MSMDQLAAQAGVSKRTVYRHFKSKEEIIETVIEKMLLWTEKRIKEIISDCPSPEIMLKELLTHFLEVGRTLINPVVLDDLRRHYPHLWQRIDDFRMARAHMLVQTLITKSSKDGIRDIDSRIITRAVTASIQAVINPEFIINNGLTFEETVGQLLLFFKKGLFD